MKTTKEETPSREVLLTIELEEADLEPFRAQAARRLGQRVRIPGFRQGKAPRVLVENFVGREAIREEAVDLLVAPTVEKVVTEEKLEPFDVPQVEVTSQEPVNLKVTVPLTPAVELGNYRTIRVETKEVEVTAEHVQETIERIRYEAAPWEPVTRPARFGDLLTLDVDGWMDGRQISQDRSIDYVLRQENRLPLPGFAVHLEGLNKDEVKEFTLTVPEDYPDKSAVGKECRFRVKVLDIKEKRLPELNDEFARSLGESYESMEVLREKVRGQLRAEAETAEVERVREAALSKLVEQAKVDYSPLLLEREVSRQMERRQQALRQNRIGMDDYLAVVGMSEDELREAVRTRARERLVRSLVLGRLAEAEGIEVSPEEMDKEIDSAVQSAERDPASVRELLSSEEGKRSVRNMILTRKVMERLREIATASSETAPGALGDEQEKETSKGGDADGN